MDYRKIKQRGIGSLSPINLALITNWWEPARVCARSFDERVGDNSIGGDDIHDPTTAFQWMLRSCGARHPATRAPVLQAIKELARTSMEQVLNLLDGNEVFQSQTQSRTKWGSEDSKTGGWTSTHAYKQVAKAKLDLNKTQYVYGSYRSIWGGRGRPGRGGGRPKTLGRTPIGPHLIHGPLGQNQVTQHRGQKRSR